MLFNQNTATLVKRRSKADNASVSFGSFELLSSLQINKTVPHQKCSSAILLCFAAWLVRCRQLSGFFSTSSTPSNLQKVLMVCFDSRGRTLSSDAWIAEPRPRESIYYDDRKAIWLHSIYDSIQKKTRTPVAPFSSERWYPLLAFSPRIAQVTALCDEKS